MKSKYMKTSSIQLLKYICIGIFNTLLGYTIIFFCMYILEFNPVISNMISYAIGLLSTYLLNRTLTFHSTGKKRKEVIRFFIAFAIAYLANLTALIIFIDYFNIHEGFSQILASMVYVAFSFPLLKFYVYHSKTLQQNDESIPKDR